MNGAVELYKACSKHGDQADRRLRDLLRRRPRRARRRGKVERNHLTLLAADDAGYRNLVKLSSAGFLEGLQRGKPTVDMGQLERHAEGVIALTGCLASRFCQRLLEDRDDGRARPRRRAAAACSARENVYFEVQKNGLAAAGQVQRGDRADRPRGRRPLVGTGDVHYLRREDYDHHTALLCVQTKSTLAAAEADLRHQRVLPARQRRDGAARSRSGPRRSRARSRSPSAATVELELGKQLIPQLPDARRQRRARVPARARRGGPARCATATRRRPRRVERMEMELGVIDRMGFNAYFLIVWDFVKFAKENGIAVGPGRGSAAGSIVAYCLRDHRRRPAALRPAVRALPQPRARVDAGHRHRLLGARPRARDALRDREVRPRVGRADRHLRQDVPARGDARRGARARLRLRRRRPPGEADPRPDHGPRRRRSRTA